MRNGRVPEVLEYLDEASAENIQQEIAEASGREVFVRGITDEDRRVVSAQVLARGHTSAVPALLKVAKPGDVVIHNHPSGNLEPSEADLAVASALGDGRVGFYIVDNDVSDIYAVVEPFGRVEARRLNVVDVTSYLKPEGPVAQRLEDYEYRHQQLDMVAHVVDAFNDDRIAMIEAGTGTGKTIAYLLPAILWALENRERCVVSTNTINLQQQVINKDIPFLQSVVGRPFTAVLAKGRSNYVCMRKLMEAASEQELFVEESRKELNEIARWAKKTKDGSKSDLGFSPVDEVWERIQSESDTTLRSRCEYYQQCFFYNARRKAAEADVLVVNHHLLFADMALRASHRTGSEVAVLPAYDRLILDESHNVEDAASNYFGIGVTRWGMKRTLGRLYRIRGSKIQGHLARLRYNLHLKQRTLSPGELSQFTKIVENDLIPGVDTLKYMVDEVMDGVAHLILQRVPSRDQEVKVRVVPAMLSDQAWEQQVRVPARTLCREIRRYNRIGFKLIEDLENLPGDLAKFFLAKVIETKAQFLRLDAIADGIEFVLLEDDQDHVRWIEVRERANESIVRLRSCPLEVGGILEGAMYNRQKTIVMTSATLAVDGSLDYLKARLGLGQLGPERLIESIIPAPFDYEKQAIIVVPDDMPNPNSPHFPDVLSGRLLETLLLTGGRAFVLFTSFSLLNKMYDMLHQPLAAAGITTLKQGSLDRHKLLEHFKADVTSVLLGTDSFWEGVDVHGEALEAVIIPRLPFRVPTEPLIEARVEAIEQRGGNAFLEYTVPQAAIKFKQGFGRLIRRKTDRGCILIFDNRVIKKSYGRIFLNTLPATPVAAGNRARTTAALKSFFDGGW